MPESVHVAPEDLLVSAATVDAHADDMWAAHGSANARTESAGNGVPTGSGVALAAAVAKWQQDSTALFGRLVEHSGALRAGGVAYEQTDQQSAAAIDAVDLGL